MKNLVFRTCLILFGLAWFALYAVNVSPNITATRHSFDALPPAAQAAISTTLGRDAREYDFTATSDAFQATNPTQNITAQITAAGMTIARGQATWNLALAQVGAPDALQAVPDAPPVAVQSNRIELARGALTEWFVNGPRGIEQGWTLHSPLSDKSEVVLALASSGTLSPHPDADGLGLQLTDASGNVKLLYRGLTAYDATGRALPAWLETAPALVKQTGQDEQVLVHLDTTDAHYPIVVDPFVEQAKLTASDGAAVDLLGYSTSISGDTVVVGAPYDDGQRGSAYVFVKPVGGWANATETGKLTASDRAGGDQFGYDVGIYGDTIVVGAQTDDSGKGSAYVFVKPVGGWATATETAKLTASDGVANDFFGRSVDITTDTIVIGASGTNTARGSVYVFIKPGGGWATTSTFAAKLTASAALGGENLGDSVGISGDTIVSGAPFANAGNGAAYVFVKPGGGWASGTETAELTASDGAPGDEFGSTIAISGNTVVVGAFNNNGARGAAYVYVKPVGAWVTATETAKLTASDGVASDQFGASVGVSANIVVVGANVANAAYVFVKPGGGWATTSTFTQKLTASGGAAGDAFGDADAISGNTVVVGAFGNNGARGAAYIFQDASVTTTFTVTTTDDHDDGACTVADCTLREAINAANLNPGADIIDFSVNGTITLGSTLPAIDDDVTIDGTAHTITVSGNDSVQVLQVNVGKVLDLKTLTFSHGLCTDCPGGAIANNGTLNATDCIFSNNTATTSGGGDANGGAIDNEGTLTVTDCTFSNNTATASGTGGSNGGAIYNGDILTVTHTTFSTNTASVTGSGEGSGGAIFSGGSNSSVTDSTFDHNHAFGDGGAIALTGSTLNVTNSTFDTNTGDDAGGGIYNNVGNLIVTNSTFSGNRGGVRGGGIGDGGSGTVTVVNSTLSGNGAPDGGGLSDDTGDTTLYNTIVANSTSGGDCAAGAFGTISADTFNLDTDGSCDNATTKTSAQINLDTLGDNGGPTQTMALLAGSQAIDAGDDDVCSADVGDPTYGAGAKDQRGITRPQGPSCDVGAFERETTTAINVAGFRGTIGKAGQVVLHWQTTTESQIAGFNIWRKTGRGTFKKINLSFRQAKHPGDAAGARYRFKDSKVRSGKTYRYKLELVMLDGRSVWSNITRVTVK